MKKIALTKGYVAVVGDEDFDFLMQWSWHAFPSASGHVYAARNSEPVNGRRQHIFMHREIARTPHGLFTDHINGNALDNRRGNLRVVTKTQNMWNRRANDNGTSKHKGVSWHKQHRKWIAAIQVNKRRFHIGLFDTEEGAAMAYAARAAREFGQYNRGFKNG
jgi:hypothetical protein